MTESSLRKIKAWMLLTWRFIWQRKGLWLRAALCWMVGITFTLADREFDYDTRLFIRGEQTKDEQIVIVQMRHEDWSQWVKAHFTQKNTPTPTSFITDSYFWNENAWSVLLKKLLDESPLVVGVSYYFGENLNIPPIESLKSPIFSDSRIVWSTIFSTEGRTLSTWFGKKRNRTVGVNEPFVDSDGIVRRLVMNTDQVPSLAIQLLNRHPDFTSYDYSELKRLQPAINFRGKSNSFEQIQFSDFVDGRYASDFFKNKIVLLGSADVEGAMFRTPNGVMTRDEITATAIDNIKNERWIHRPHLAWIGLLYLLFVLLSAWVTSHYPQTFAFILIVCFNLFYATLSLWFFDAYYIWTPIFATALVSLVTYVTFLSFQLTLKEYLNLQLENERQFLFELEQLKNNFLSLISHDLKTPIAKIQAICDRLMAQYPDRELNNDLTSLRDVASELHRYIRTILEITRVESRNFSINKDAADINEIIEAVALQLDPLARNKKIQIVLNLEPMFLIEVDQILIHEVVLNLIENAIKYTPDGGVVKVSSREVDDRVLVMVEDNGPGIPPEEQMRIFEKFYRGELGKAQPKGSGLGLYLVKYFVELHHGKVFLESHLNQGTKVGFTLPISENALISDELTQADPQNDEAPNEIRA